MSEVPTLVTAEWLLDKISQSDPAKGQLRILDVTFDRFQSIDTYKDCYLKEHIPQAVHFDLHKCVESTTEIPRNLPDTKAFTEYVRSLGVGAGTHVIVYDRNDMVPAFRTWWLFRLYGHKRVSILDGGLAKWKACGYEMSQEEPTVQRTDDFVVSINESLKCTYEDMLKIVTETKDTQIVDTRLQNDPKVLHRELDGGIIPGSLRCPYSLFFNDDLTMKSKEEMKEALTQAGVELGSSMVTTCNTGMTACCVAAVASILGRENVPVYYGSWTEWKWRSPDELKQRVEG